MVVVVFVVVVVVDYSKKKKKKKRCLVVVLVETRSSLFFFFLNTEEAAQFKEQRAKTSSVRSSEQTARCFVSRERERKRVLEKRRLLSFFARDCSKLFNEEEEDEFKEEE